MTGLIAALLLMAQPVETTVSLDDAAWLEGCWAGEGFGAPVSECWMRAPSGTITGMFQMMDETGEQNFSEIFVLGAFDTGYAMRLKHFNRDLSGWESQEGYVNFPLLATDETSLTFEGLVMRRVGEEGYESELTVHGEDGDRIVRFEFTRTH